MSHIVARMQKMKVGNLGGAYRHNERIFENHSNKDIDTERSHLNYELTDRERSVSYEKQIKDYVNENKISQRAIRKDAVLCDEWIITSDKAFFEKLSPGETRSFFEAAKDYFAENYGEQNIAYASVHMDESTPHMHLGIVPMRDGKLSSKAMFDREELKKIQDELPQYLNEQGFELERGARNSEAKHKTVAEFKKDRADKELELELLQKGAPEFVNENTGEIATQEEYEQAMELQNKLNCQITIRETTLQEKIDWMKLQYREELQKLESYQKASEAHISDLNEEMGRKSSELKKIESRASQSLSELSEVSSQLESAKKELAEHVGVSNSLEQDLRTYFEGEKKKTVLGKEYVAIDPKNYEEARTVFARLKHRVFENNKKIGELEDSISRERSARLRTLEKNDELKGEVKELRQENKALRTENKGLIERLDLMTRKLNVWRKKAKEHLPTAEFKGLSKKLNEIQPLKEIIKPLKVLNKVKDVIEKSLF